MNTALLVRRLEESPDKVDALAHNISDFVMETQRRVFMRQTYPTRLEMIKVFLELDFAYRRYTDYVNNHLEMGRPITDDGYLLAIKKFVPSMYIMYITFQN